MAKTMFKRVEVDQPHVAVFKISGNLGFHQNDKITKLVDECLRRKFRKVVFDFLDLSSLGGGVARIFRNFLIEYRRRGYTVNFVVKNDVVLDFLKSGDIDLPIYSTLEAALNASEDISPCENEEGEANKESNEERKKSGCNNGEDSRKPEVLEEKTVSGAECGHLDIDLSQKEEKENLENISSKGIDLKEEPEKMKESAGENGDEDAVSEIFSEGYPDINIFPERIKTEDSTSNNKEKGVGKSKREVNTDINIKLRRRILELKTLFSISTDFNKIHNKKKLLDIFLLTAIAQGGVESAVFLEKKGEHLVPVVFKGVDKKRMEDFNINIKNLRRVGGRRTLTHIDDIVDEDKRRMFKTNEFEYIYPFIVDKSITGVFVVGKRLSGHAMNEENFEFLNILASIAESAYRNSIMFERENERTLGIVKTLISMIEENTLLKGTSEFVSRYVGVLAKKLNYPEEHFKDLIYGTVLRDMGMIKISDLIIKSPRELSKNEWSIIKKHPDDGAEMLRRMGFNNHVVDIVKSHHERFNGEGYPRGLRGKEIPLGARIISVVESYSAMIHERPTRAALSEKEALNTLKENYGLRYDREITRAFARVMEREFARSITNKEVMAKG
ncbi:MAG TPA: HD domain-containing phosphohydrolase [Candidatus Krumholzibacteriaceae bacterium]|nr:HD domain-containing phosphohydrolase [Candidatus Krumholzibacteriaceae bacterium]